MIIIFVLSSIPGDVEDETSLIFNLLHPTFKNLLHIPLYGILQFLWLRSLIKLGKKGIKAAMICLAITNGYGILNKTYQTFVPGRYGSVPAILLNFKAYRRGGHFLALPVQFFFPI